MTQRCAQILNGVVVNVIIADPTFNPGDGSVLVVSTTAQSGWTYANGTFTPVAAPVPTQGLTFQQLLTLFTAAELTAIITAAATKPIILTWLFKMAAQGTINLADPQVTTALTYLVAQSLITAPRATAIQSGSVQNPGA